MLYRLNILVFFLLALLFGDGSASHARSQPSPATETLAGMEANNRGNHTQAFLLLRKATDAGDPEAAANLGYLFTRGHGVAPDAGMALQLYRRAAEAGSSEGMNALGYRYDHGGGVERNSDEAVRWYCRALLRGNPRALNNLGLMVAYGRGVPVDLPEAVSLWEQAAALGHANAMLNLGMIYLQPSVIGPDLPAAVSWLENAAWLGQEHAQALLRRMGRAGAFPPPVDYTNRMAPAPEGKAGHSKLCGTPIA